MYQTPEAWSRLIDVTDTVPDIKSKGKTQARLLVEVEAGLHLAELLGFADEPITVSWFLLSGTPTLNRRLERLTPNQRHMLAVGRVVIPLNSRFAWEAALRDYIKLPTEHRNYNFNIFRLDQQIIDSCKSVQPATDDRLNDLEQIFKGNLELSVTTVRRPQANIPYWVMINTSAGWQNGKVTFTAEQIAIQDRPVQWFDHPQPRQPIHINLADLRATAECLDAKDIKLGRKPRWVEDYERLDYRHLDKTEKPSRLTEKGEHTTLDLDGFAHIAGIVSSGKTTLVKLIAAHAIIHNWDIRITMVVGDTNTAISTAHQFNEWFCDDPATADPVAVPILGKSTRNVHLGRMQASYEYQQTETANHPHWGERWLNPVCPLEALIKWDEGKHEDKIPIGSEPCTNLAGSTPSGTNATKAGENAEKQTATKVRKQDKTPLKKERLKSHVCPFFSICPSKQMYHDMPKAKFWITTPGALTQSGVPRQVDARPIKIGDLIYEQSDLVVFDEVETVMEWFDNTYTQRLDLTNGSYGLLDRLDEQVADYLRANRTPPPEFQKWVFAERAATKAVSTILTLLDPEQGQNLLRMWLHKGDFTRNTLSYRIARRLTGLKETPSKDAELNTTEEGKVRPILSVFEKLGENPFGASPVDQNSSLNEIDIAVRELTVIMRQMNSSGQDIDEQAVIEQCKEWIITHFPTIEADLEALRNRLDTSGDDDDKRYAEKGKVDRDVTDLAIRLFFTLCVVVLDWHLGVVLYEWHRKPAEIFSEQPYSKIPRGLHDVLPLPAFGRQFAIYRAPIASDQTANDSNRNRLSQFVYMNIGRWMLTNFHRLRTDIDRLRGPNVLALSGTSYLPDSSRFHVQVELQGVLATHADTRTAIEASHFEFLPMREAPEKDKPEATRKEVPITISGKPKKNTQLKNLIAAMVASHREKGGEFGRMLAQLDQNANDDPAHWADRSRLLLFTNSYDQAKAAATALQHKWPEMREKIFYLSRGKDGQDHEAQQNDLDGTDSVRRIDIEQFASTGGKILVAPMASVGRGFNILNNPKDASASRKAAFGAVYFLIRPMWQPHDQLAMAQELNRYTLQWAVETNPIPDALMYADGLYQTGTTLRDTSRQLWQKMQARQSYESLTYPTSDPTKRSADDPELKIAPLYDLAASTAGQIIQAAGRLLRGGVPFYAYFVDAAWAPRTVENHASQPEYPETSLLQAMTDRLTEYASEENLIGFALYEELANKFATMHGMYS